MQQRRPKFAQRAQYAPAALIDALVDRYLYGADLAIVTLLLWKQPFDHKQPFGYIWSQLPSSQKYTRKGAKSQENEFAVFFVR